MKYFRIPVFLLCCVMSVWGQSSKPTIVFSTLLNNIHMVCDSGQFHIDYLTAVNLPVPENQAEYQYNPQDGAKLSVQFMFGEYETPFTVTQWYAKKEIDPFWSMQKYDVDMKSQPSSKEGKMRFKTPGQFSMDFYLDDDLFYSFPFSISRIAGDTIAQGTKELYFLDGPWEDYGYLFYLAGNPAMKLSFVTWLRNKDKRPAKKVSILGVLMRDGSPVAKTAEGPKEYTLKQEWQRFEFALGNSKRDEEGILSFNTIRAEDILNTPGNYELLLTIDNQLYGMYSFAVEEGSFRIIKEQDPHETSSKKLIYGDSGTVWLQRKQ